uniref:Uncharacterized protein n=1 Tax=Timema monikensis TaxID=170555 RepID=A0A7R9E292_9NEOP|nr:unnamed protein product [Timema monikensis]
MTLHQGGLGTPLTSSLRHAQWCMAGWTKQTPYLVFTYWKHPGVPTILSKNHQSLCINILHHSEIFWHTLNLKLKMTQPSFNHNKALNPVTKQLAKPVKYIIQQPFSLAISPTPSIPLKAITHPVDEVYSVYVSNTLEQWFSKAVLLHPRGPQWFFRGSHRNMMNIRGSPPAYTAVKNSAWSVTCLKWTGDSTSTLSSNCLQKELLMRIVFVQGDCWVLEVPSLRWIQLVHQKCVPRLWHRAQFVGANRLLIVGGHKNNILDMRINKDHAEDMVVIHFSPDPLLRLCLDVVTRYGKQLQSEWTSLPRREHVKLPDTKLSMEYELSLQTAITWERGGGGITTHTSKAES